MQWLLIRCELQSREQDGVNGRDSCCRPISRTSTAAHQLGLGPRGRGALREGQMEDRVPSRVHLHDTDPLTANATA